LVQKLLPDDDSVNWITQRVFEQLERTLRQAPAAQRLEQFTSEVDDVAVRKLVFTPNRDRIRVLIQNEVKHWLTKQLKELRPLRRVLVDDLRTPFQNWLTALMTP
jgi:hypothetical protein